MSADWRMKINYEKKVSASLMGRLRRPFMPRPARGGFSFCMMTFKAESPQPMVQRLSVRSRSFASAKAGRLNTHFIVRKSHPQTSVNRRFSIFSLRNSSSPKARIAEALCKTGTIRRRGSAGLRRNLYPLLQEPRGTPDEASLVFASAQPDGGSASGGKAGAIERRRALEKFRNNNEEFAG